MPAQTVLTLQGEQQFCPECGSLRISTHAGRGEVVCQRCGRVLEEDIVEVLPAQAYTDEEREKKARVGAPLTFTRGARGVTTTIGRNDDLSQLSGERRRKYRRLRRLHQQMSGAQRGTLRYALAELKQFSSTLSLPTSVHEEVARLYEKAMDQGVVRGRRIEHVLGALIYIVSRNQGTPRTLDEIQETIGATGSELGQTYRYVARELGLRILPIRAEDYLPRFAGELELSGEVQARAHHIIEQVREQDLQSGKGPTGVAAAALFVAAEREGDDPVPQRFVESLNVSRTTLRKRTAEFRENIGD